MAEQEYPLIRPPIAIDDPPVHVEGTFGAARVSYTTTVNGEPYDEQRHGQFGEQARTAQRRAKFYELANMLLGRGELTEPSLEEMHTKAFYTESGHAEKARAIYRFCLYGRIIEYLNKDDLVAAGRLLFSMEDDAQRAGAFRDIAGQSVRAAGLLLERLDLVVPQGQYERTVMLFARRTCIERPAVVPLTALLAAFSDQMKAVRLFVNALQDTSMRVELLSSVPDDEFIRFLCLANDREREVIFSVLPQERILAVLELLAVRGANSEKRLRVLSGFVTLEHSYFSLLSARAAAAVLDTLTTRTAAELLAPLPVERQSAVISEMMNMDKALLLLVDPARAALLPVVFLVSVWERADRSLLPQICASWDPVLIGKVVVAMNRKRLEELQEKKIISREFVEQAFKALS